MLGASGDALLLALLGRASQCYWRATAGGSQGGRIEAEVAGGKFI